MTGCDADTSLEFRVAFLRKQDCMTRTFSPRWYTVDEPAFVTLAMFLRGLGSVEITRE